MRVPKTIDGAVKQLAGIGKLVTAKEWERAAIVYAFTCPHDPISKSNLSDKGQVSWSTFASYGIIGLKSQDTVRAYWDNWNYAISKRKAKRIKAGDEIAIPKLDWPPTGHDIGKRNALGPNATVDEKAQLVRELLDTPAVAEEIYRDPERVDYAITIDAAHTARNRRIVDPMPVAQDVDYSISYHREEDDSEFLNALSFMANASLMLNSVARCLTKVELTDVQKAQLEQRYERLATKLEMLRASTSAGSIDDELAEILKGTD
jgi:hypothetical protein